jgi:hypothetical protein
MDDILGTDNAAAGIAGGQTLDLLGERKQRAWAVAEEAPHGEFDNRRLRADRQVAQAPPITAVDPCGRGPASRTARRRTHDMRAEHDAPVATLYTFHMHKRQVRQE